MKRGDASIESSNTPTGASYKEEARDFSLHRCVIIQRKFVDDDENVSKDSTVPDVMYDVQVIGGFKEGHVFVNCRLIQKLGGDSNFSERVLKPATKPLDETGLAKTDGDIVIVGFVGGDSSAGVILGGLNQPLDKDQTGAAKSDGTRFREQYNGVLTTIDKDGNYTLTRLGGKYNDATGEFEPDEAGKAVIVSYTDNSITRSVKDSAVKEELLGDSEQIVKTFKSGLKVTEDGAGDKTSVSTKGGLTQTVDGSSDSVSVVTKGGLKVTSDGSADSFTVETSGGAKVSVDGSAGTIEIDSGSAKIMIDAAGKITLSGDFVDLGASASDFVTKFTELATAFATHTHTGNLALPTSPPLAPLLPSVGSLTVKVQS